MAASPDGRLVASAGWDRTVRLWDVERAAPLGVLEGHANNVNAVAFLPDGKTLISGSYDGTLKLWRLADGSVLRTLKGHGFGVTDVAVSRDGRLALSASVDETLRLWDLGSGREIHAFLGHEGPIFAVAVSAGGRLAASAGADRRIHLWDLAEQALVKSLDGHDEPVWALAFTADERRLLSAGSDQVVRVWDVASGREIDGAGDAGQPRAEPWPRIEGHSRGEELARACMACHTVTRDGGNRAGPTLYGVFGRRAGSVAGYRYSEALADSTLVWTGETIDALFAEGPHTYTPGSKMPLQRMPKAEDRAELIAYLRRVTAESGPAGDLGQPKDRQ